MNPVCWALWRKYFASKGYECMVPSYPFHEGEPSKLRNEPDPGLGRLGFSGVVETIAKEIAQLESQPLLIGHSMGGLVVQKLISMQLVVAGVCIDSPPTKGIRSFRWSFIRSNFPTINPF